MTDIISKVVLGSFWAHVAWPRAQLLGQSVTLKFSLETRLESKSFEPLIDFLAFLVQNLSFKINKLFYYLTSQLLNPKPQKVIQSIKRLGL